MSRLSEPTSQQSNNPIQRYLEWHGSMGQPKHWNGNETELSKIPFSFLLIGVKASITGWNGATDSRIWSNYFTSGNDIVTIRDGKGELVKGIWNEIKSDLPPDAHYTSNLFVLLLDGTQAVFSIKKSTLGAWMDFMNENKLDLDKSVVTISNFIEKKKGATKYRVPVFTAKEGLDSELDEKADVYASLLDEYLGLVPEKVYVEEVVADFDEVPDGLPF